MPQSVYWPFTGSKKVEDENCTRESSIVCYPIIICLHVPTKQVTAHFEK